MRILFSIIAWASAAAAADIPAQNRISAVTVYGDRAWVTRSAKLSLPSGESNIIFEELPPGLLEDSLSAAVRSGPVRILGLELQRKYSDEPRDQKIRALQRELEQLLDKQKELGHRIEVGKKQLEFADKIQIFQSDKISKDLPLKDVSPLDWDHVLKFLEKTRLEKFAHIQKTETEARELSRTIEAKRSQLNALTSAHSSQSIMALVRLAAKAPSDAEVDLRYVIEGASWRPSYDARADVQAKETELTYLGTVTQRTGEDWREVKISLSTAKPSLGAHLDPLTSIYLTRGHALNDLREKDGEYKPMQQAQLRQVLEPAAAAPAEGSSGWETAENPLEGPSALYNTAGVQTIPSGNRSHRVTISAHRFKMDLSYAAAPKAQPFAFLKSTLRNHTPNHLLPGPVNVFLGGDFVGQSRLNAIAPEQEFILYLGIDERMKVKREQLVDKSRDSWWGKKLVLSQAFRITAENYTGTKQICRIYDQIPVSKDASIEVRYFKAELAPELIKEETGELRWRLELAQGEKRVIEFSYEVVFPEEIASQPGAHERLRRYQATF